MEEGAAYRRNGNTSACAEKSLTWRGWHGCGWKYLRVRGEEQRGPNPLVT